MKKNNRFKLNNSGSTLVFVVVALIFIGLLASLIMALTVSGFKMKNVDYDSRQSFYESEEYTGKIYSEIGMNALGILGEAYTTTMGKLNSGSIGSEIALNQHIKELYYKNMLVYLRIVNNDAAAEAYVTSQKTSGAPVTVAAGDTAITDRVLPLLKNMVKDPDDPTILGPNLKIKGSIVCDLEGATDAEGQKFPTITINDVQMKYVDDTKFETNLTFDIVIRYPEWDFTYSNPVSTGNDIDTYLDYVLISNDGIEFDGITENVYGSVATGTNGVVAVNDDDRGINIASGSNVKFYVTSDYYYSPLEIVVTDNIVVNSSATSSGSLEVHGGEVWCNSILLKKPKLEAMDNTNKSYLLANGSRLYIQDDLQLDGDNSTATIKKDETKLTNNSAYIGFSNNTITNTQQQSQNSSSAIIINGNNASVNIEDVSKLYVSGLAYIDYVNRAYPYRTGESLAVKGNQDMYMVPDTYMGENFSNPTASGMSDADLDVVENNLLNNFFAKQYLDPTNPFVTKNYYLNGKNYLFLYLNFSSPSDQTSYVIDVLTVADTDTAVEKEVREKVLKNLSEMNMSTNEFLSATLDTDGKIYTAGAVVTAAGGTRTGTASATNTNSATVAVDNMSYFNRFRLMKSLLMTLEDEDGILNNYSQVYSTMFKEFNTNDPTNYPTEYGAIENYLLNHSAITNFINLTKLKQYVPALGTSWSRGHSDGELMYARAAAGTPWPVGNFTGVMVVDGDVEISGNVTGLIIATGKITITGGGTLTAKASLVDSILTDEQNVLYTATDGPKSDVFLAYPVPSPDEFGESINQLKYADVLYYDNWRKYEDDTTY